MQRLKGVFDLAGERTIFISARHSFGPTDSVGKVHLDDTPRLDL